MTKVHQIVIVAVAASVASMLCVLLAGCGSPPPSAAVLKPAGGTTIFDHALMSPDISNRVWKAQQDLPGDRWAEGQPGRPGRHNASRADRESAIATELLTALKPKLKELPAHNLIASLKTYPYTQPANYFGVAYYLYMWGNQEIIRQLHSKTPEELRALDKFKNDDKTEVFTGDNGPPLTIRDLVQDVASKGKS